MIAALLALAGAPAAPDWKAEARAIYADAIAIPTVAGRGKVPDLAAQLARRFRDAGFEAGDVIVRPYGETAALIVRWPGSDAKSKPVLLMAHMDVVDARREDWSMDPFVLTERDGFFYGRGTADDKQGVTGITSAILRLKREGFRPRRGLTILFTGDEETEGKGADLAASLWPETKNVAYVLNGDDGGGVKDAAGRMTAYEIQGAEKSYFTYTLTVRNRGGHSSVPRDDNAIYQLGTALGKLAAYRFTPALNPVTKRYFELRAAITPRPLGDAMRRFAADPRDRAAADMLYASEAERGVERTTCVATRIEGGHADNALPGMARATVNCRALPGVGAEAVRRDLKAAVADPGVAVETKDAYDSGPATALDPAVLKPIHAVLTRRFPGVALIPIMSRGATDAAFFRARGIPTYCIDLMWRRADEEGRMHGRDERVEVTAFYDSVDIWREVVVEVAK